MADLNVENFPEDLQQALRREAEAAGRTLSEHVVELLEDAVRARPRSLFDRRPQPSMLGERTVEYVVEGPDAQKTKIALDEKLLGQVRRILSTSSIEETVEEALREVARQEARRREIEALSRMEGMDLDDPEIMARAWAR